MREVFHDLDTEISTMRRLDSDQARINRRHNSIFRLDHPIVMKPLVSPKPCICLQTQPIRLSTPNATQCIRVIDTNHAHDYHFQTTCLLFQSNSQMSQPSRTLPPNPIFKDVSHRNRTAPTHTPRINPGWGFHQSVRKKHRMSHRRIQYGARRNSNRDW